MNLGIVITNNPSGGGIRHILEILNEYDKSQNYIFSDIYFISSSKVSRKIPNYKWLKKINPSYLDKSFLYKLNWLFFHRDNFLHKKIDILFDPFGTYLGNFKPFVSMSQNMLLFDKKERNRFFLSFRWFKLTLLSSIQSLNFKNANSIIFISKYAKSIIEKKLKIYNINNTVINHGISDNFRQLPKLQKPITSYQSDNKFKILYVSNIWVYKHHLNLIKAFLLLIDKGYNLELNLVGNNDQIKIGNYLSKIVSKNSSSIIWHKNIELENVNYFYKKCDLFVFPSTCENMPNILIEAMSSGIPICSSNYSPMPEFLKDGGLYFDPLDINDIAFKIESIIINPELRYELSQKSYNYSLEYSWKKCSHETFNLLHQIAINYV